jgi:SAM-dependent methyltransferase
LDLTYIARKIILSPVTKIKNTFFWDHYYSSLREPKVRNGFLELQRTTKEMIIQQFEAVGINPKPFTIDQEGYLNYFKKANYSRFRYCPETMLPEKSLEHYVAAEILALTPKDVYIDIASAKSPAPSIYAQLYGCIVYKQDLIYPKGLHGNVIGGDACELPLPDGFASKMALHCSFEHFEGNADTLFIQEASRVLTKGGKLCILPLYLTERFGIVTNPILVPKQMVFDEEALLYCEKRCDNRHGRFYDAKHFVERIVSKTNLKLTLYAITNETEIDPACYLKFMALFEK